MSDAQYDKYLEEGDYETFIAKMHIKQFVHVTWCSAAAHEVPAGPAVGGVPLTEHCLERRGCTLDSPVAAGSLPLRPELAGLLLRNDRAQDVRQV